MNVIPFFWGIGVEKTIKPCILHDFTEIGLLLLLFSHIFSKKAPKV